MDKIINCDDYVKTQEELMKQLENQIKQTNNCEIMHEIAMPGVDTRINKNKE